MSDKPESPDRKTPRTDALYEKHAAMDGPENLFTEEMYEEIVTLCAGFEQRDQELTTRYLEMQALRDEELARAVRAETDLATLSERLAGVEKDRDEAYAKSDAEMLRVKACEHIAEDDEWEVLRNICPSTAAVALLRDRAESAEARIATLSDALRGVYSLIESGYLVRDTSRDHEPGWALRQLEPARKLASAFAALSPPEPGEQT